MTLIYIELMLILVLQMPYRAQQRPASPVMLLVLFIYNAQPSHKSGQVVLLRCMMCIGAAILSCPALI